MDRERPFLTETPRERQFSQKNQIRQYEHQELEGDMSAFPEDVQPMLEKMLRGEKLEPEEQSAISVARQEWWYEKYGFNYNDKAVREEVILRKYAPSAELSQAQEMQHELFAAFRSGDQSQIDEIQRRYEERYPNQLLGVTALFEIVPYLNQQEALDTKSVPSKERGKFIELNTQDAFLLTHFLSSNSADKEFVRLFWDAAERMAKDAGKLKTLNKMRRGILSQVAVKKVFDSLGMKPRLSHPKEDAFEATDLWTESGEAIQVKGHTKGAAIVPTDNVSAVGVQVKGRDGELHFDSYLNNEMQKFRMKIGKYGLRTGRDIKGYLIRIPYSEFDAVTGEPTGKFIDFIRQELSEAGVDLERSDTDGESHPLEDSSE